MSEMAGQVSLLGGNWTSTLVDGAHFFAVLGFLQQSPKKLPLKCSPWHRSCRSPRKARCPGAHLGRAPALHPGPSFPPAPQSRPCRDPTGGSAHMASPCGPGAVGARGQSQRWGRVAHSTLQELRAPTAWAPGRYGSERRRCSDYLPIGNVSTDLCSRGRRQRAHLGRVQSALLGQRCACGAGRVLRAFMCMDSTCVHGDTAQKDRHGEFTVESRQWVYECSPNMSFNFSLFGSFHNKMLEDVNLTTVRTRAYFHAFP